MITVSVFGSSSIPETQQAGVPYSQARELGRCLAQRGFAVCTGGYGGVMEAVSRGACEAGGHTIGVTARIFTIPANPWVREEIQVATWRERLFELLRRADGYVICPGGSGTLVASLP